MTLSKRAKSTVRERAADYFGKGNVAKLRAVPLGKGRYGFASPTRLWIYEEYVVGRQGHGVVIKLTDKRRRDLLAALSEGEQ